MDSFDFVVVALSLLPALGFAAWVRSSLERIERDLIALDSFERSGLEIRLAADRARLALPGTSCR